MSIMTNMLAKDDAATPIEYTFLPVSDNPDAFYRCNVAGIPLEGQPRYTFKVEKLKNGGYKLTAKLEVPVMETLGASGTSAGYVAPPKVAYVNTLITTMFADRRSTNADRMNLLKMGVGMLQGASATTATGILTQATAGQGWTSSILPGPTFFNTASQPN